jgi:hypothetical protein
MAQVLARRTEVPRGMALIPILVLALVSLTGCAATSASNDQPKPAAAAQLSASPSSVAFGNTQVGTTGSSQTITISDSGGSTLTLSQANVSGAGFGISGLALPLTLNPSQSTSFSVSFAPTSAGSVSGSVSLVSDASNSPTMITLTGSGVQSQLSASPTSISFGNVLVGTTKKQSVTLSVSGSGASVTVSQASVSGTGFSVSGLSLPLTLNSGQSTSFAVSFAPATTGNFTGSISLANDSSDSPIMVALSGTAVQPQLSVVPSSVAFGDVVVGNTNTQTLTLSNSGTANLTISQITVSGTGFSTTGVSLPITLSPGQKSGFNVAFAPTGAGSVTGSLSLVSDAPDSPATVPLSGTGISATYQLSASPTSLSFGDVTVGTSTSQTATLSNNGNSSVTISQVTVSGAGFSASGVTPPLTLEAGQSVTLTVTFAPTTAGSVTGSLSITSNASNSPATISLSGSGGSTTSHSVSLNWNASTSVVVGYNVYRATISGGPYSKVNSSLISGTSFTDSTVQAGQTYFYVTTAVDSNSNESTYSNEVSATIPSP